MLVFSLGVTGRPAQLAVVVAFLRLGKKYEIEILHAEALRRLHHDFPSNPENFNKWGSGPFNECRRRSMIEWEYGKNVAVANLAREQGLLCVLPLALYRCCQSHSAKHLLTGVPGKADALATDNLLACLSGWSSLGGIQYTTTFAWAHSSASTYPNCTSRAECAQIRKDTLHAICVPTVQLMGEYPWSELADFQFDFEVDGMCSSCTSVAEVMHNNGRGVFWEQLPGIFGQPGWAELRKA